MIRFLLALLALAAVPAAAQFERAPGQGQKRENAITPELVVNKGGVPGASAELAIVMKVKPGWHGYWLNPGAAGLPMSVDWTLPRGWSVGPLRYPVPSRLDVAGIVNYVYEDDYALLTKLTIAAGAAPGGEIAADMRWLACTDKICVPEEGTVRLVVPAGGKARADRRFDDWRRALPRPLASKARFERVGETVRLAVPLPAAVAVSDPYFYPATEGAVDYDAPQAFSRDGDFLIAELRAGSLRPETIAGVLAYRPGEGLELTAVPGAVDKGGGPVGATEIGLLAALLGALAGGLLLNLMPCVFPILAMKALHLARAGGEERTARHEALAYTAGAMTGTAALGGILLALRAGGEAAGWAFQLQDPRTILLLLLLATAITLNLLKLYALPVLGGERSNLGSFGTGALAAFVATPCAGPFMGVALGAALLLPLASAVIVFVALGLGLALPFLAIAFVPWLRRKLPSPGPWMVRLQRFLAVPMAATVVAALWLLNRQSGSEGLLIGFAAVAALGGLLAAIGFVQRRRAVPMLVALAGVGAIFALSAAFLPSKDSGRSAVIRAGVERWSPAALAAARSAQKPVFLYFTADWCLTCKVNEAAAINQPNVTSAFRKAEVVVMAGDWTNGDPEIGRFLESNGRAGVPLYLWYAPGSAKPEELPQILTRAMLIERASSVRK